MTLSTTQNCMSSGMLLAFLTGYYVIVWNFACCLTFLLLRYYVSVVSPVVVTTKDIPAPHPAHLHRWPLGRKNHLWLRTTDTEKESSDLISFIAAAQALELGLW